MKVRVGATSGGRRATWWMAAAVGALAIGMVGCGSDDDSAGVAAQQPSPSVETSADDTTVAASDAPDAPSTGAGSTASGGFVQLAVDPCTLLTVPEMEVAIGPGVEQGGFGDDLPGRCTYSIGGDVGAGSVAVSLDDPLVCAALRRALDAGGTGSGTPVDVGSGGIVATDGGALQFLAGGGCVGIHGSAEGRSLGAGVLVVLATAAAGRIG